MAQMAILNHVDQFILLTNIASVNGLSELPNNSLVYAEIHESYHSFLMTAISPNRDVEPKTIRVRLYEEYFIAEDQPGGWNGTLA
jgi:hypothetical protein